MIVQSSVRFVDSFNQLSPQDAKRARSFLKPLCSIISTLNTVQGLAGIPLSNFHIYEERGPTITARAHQGKIFRVVFDKFTLFISVSGKSPNIC